MRLAATRSALLLLPFLAAFASLAKADAPNPDSIVVAKRSGHAIVVWDASPEVKTALEKKTPDEQISNDLETAAVRILMDQAKTLTAASDIRVKVVYDRTGDVSPAYKASTFSGIEHLLYVSAPRASATGKTAAWTADLDRGKVPDGVTVEVTGKYPS